MILKYKDEGRWLILFFLIFNFVPNVFLKSQVSEAYDSIYRKTYLETSQKDFNKSLRIADSLFSVSQTPFFQTKSLMLSATLLQESGEVKKAVTYALRAEQIVTETNDLNWEVRVYGFLATQYRYLKLFNQSKKYTNKAFEVIKRINNPTKTNNLMGIMMQEKAYYELEIKNYQKSIDFINKAQYYFNLNPHNDKIFTANNEQLLGLNYYYFKQFDTALLHYDKALQNLDGSPDNYRRSLVFNGIAQVYIGKENLKKAKLYLDKAEKIACKSKHLSLKNEVYNTWEQYYTLTDSMNKLNDVSMKKDSVVKILSDNSSSFIDTVYSGLDKKNIENQKQNEIKNYIIIFSILLILLGVIFFFIYRRNQRRKNIENMEKVLAEVNKKQITNVSIPITVSQIKEVFDKTNNKEELPARIMTSSTEKNLLNKLDKFEQSTLFNRSNFSLPDLASYFNTNTKYLSYVINTHKKKDFKNYINELRILYIVQKIKTDPKYRKYKISALAEETGFSSHSKFIIAFKKVTSVSPSLFLEILEKEQKKHL